MLMTLASSGHTPSKELTDADDARLVVPHTHSKGPTDADDARLVGLPRSARGQLMLMMLALLGLTPSKGPTDADDARLVGPHAQQEAN